MSKDPVSEEKRIANGRKNFSELDTKGKITVFRDYYLLPCILILLVIAGIVWFIHDVLQSTKTVYSGATVGFDVTDEGNTFLTSGFINHMELGSKKKAVLSRNAVMTSEEELEYKQQSLEYAFTVQITAGEYQYVLMDSKNFDHYSGYDFYSNMDTFRENPTWSQEEFYIGSDGHAYGIRLPEKTLKKMGAEGKEIYLGFVVTGNGEKYNEDFLSYLFI